MEQTIFTLLTEEDQRDEAALEANLDQEFSAGAPWFDKLVETPAQS